MKYGLQIRVQPQQKKQRIKPPIPSALGFNDDDDDVERDIMRQEYRDDDDAVERDIMRQAYRNKTRKDIEEQQKKALEQDPLAFDYDGVYDQMKEKQFVLANQKRVDRQPRYIHALMSNAKKVIKEQAISYERKLAKERSKEEHLYADKDKDKYFTSAYKKKLAEQAKWMEEERLREMRETKEDVTKKTDLTDFYVNLVNNVSFGARDSSKPEKHEEVAAPPPRQVSPPTLVASPESSRTLKRDRDEIPENIKPSCETKNHHKRSVAAARERFFARKRSKV